MSVTGSVADILSQHVTLELESIDRMYLNVYVPQLQYEAGVVSFLRHHRGATFVSSALMAPISRVFVSAMETGAARAGIPLVRFEKRQRKDEVAAAYLARFEAEEGILFLGKAQEKTPVFRTQRRRDSQGRPYPWLVPSTGMVNHYYWYCVDRDFGPFFFKFASYFPYTAKVNFNGHEYLKRQLTQRGLAFEALDNGIAWCPEREQLQAIGDALTPATIEAFVRKWLARLPRPFTPEDRAAGYDYDISILQAEFSLTQVLDRALTGRVFFEEVIRENLDLGRPDQVQLIFNRRVTAKTRGAFRTRVITEGVTPSLHIDYKHSRIKQYHKEGRALRTETTINHPGDFAIGKRLLNLPAMREVGFQANRRLLHVERLSHDCAIGEAGFAQVTRPVTVQGQRAAALPFADPRVQALLAVLVLFRLLPRGFSLGDLRQLLAPLLTPNLPVMTQGRMTYDLRRLRLHGLIHRIPGTHRYRVTDVGLRTALFFTRTYARLLRPGLAHIMPGPAPPGSKLRDQFDKLEAAMDRWVQAAKLAA